MLSAFSSMNFMTCFGVKKVAPKIPLSFCINKQINMLDYQSFKNTKEKKKGLIF